MNKFFTITVLLLLASTNALAYKGYSAGLNSCGSWVESRSEGNFYTSAQWVLGYLTSYGYYSINHLKEVDSGAILTFMDNYCREKPLEDIESGAQSLINALKKK